MHGDPVAPVLIVLAVLLLAAKLGGELFERFKQPSVLGELLAGVLLGNLILLVPSFDFFEPLRVAHIEQEWAIIVDRLARLGVLLLLFEVGLESTVSEMRRVGVSSLLVAVIGVVVPFVLGYGVSWLFIKEIPTALVSVLPSGFSVSNIHLFVGATLCATSVGITARVFKDLGKMHLTETKIILGAAVIDDVLGIVILSIVAAIVTAAETGTGISVFAISQTAFLALGFLVVAIGLGMFVVRRIMPLAANFQSQGMMVVSAVVLCFLFAWLADLAGLAAIIGAFAAGLILEEVHFKGFKEYISLHDLVRPVNSLLVPLFFILMGIQVRLESFGNTAVLGFALVLTFVAILGKQVCSWGAVEKGLHRVVIGLGMIPRGEVGLIFAGIGRQLHVIDDGIFSAIVIMVIITTLVTPFALKVALAKK